MYIIMERVLEVSVVVFLTLGPVFWTLDSVVEHFLSNKNPNLLIMSTHVVKFMSSECY